MMKWNDMVVLLSILLLLFSLWKEVKRKRKSRLLWRVTATILAVASLACMALPLTYHTTQQFNKSNEAVVLTDGFNADSVNRFLKVNPNTPVLFFDKNIGAEQYNARYVADVSLLPQQYKDMTLLHVFGYGFDKESLNKLQPISLFFHLSKLAAGITAIHWQQQLNAGDPLMVQGSYNNVSAAKVKIILSSFNDVFDSAYIAAGSEGTFSLATIPKGIGGTTFSIAIVAKKDTIEKESIPVQIKQGERLKILMLASSPDFDNKFLKNRLSQEGYIIAARTIISKNKYAYDYLNIHFLSLDQINASLLSKFDMVIADAAALTAIPKSELASIQSAIAQQALGLIVKADSTVASAFYTAPFPLSAAAANTQQLITTYLFDTLNKMPALAIGYPAFIRNQFNTQPLVFDGQHKVYVSSALYGAGKIVFTTLNNTYTWALAGSEDAYKKYWAALLNKAAAKPPLSEAWSMLPALPLVNEPVQLQLSAGNAGMPQGEVNGTAVYLKMDMDLPYRWSGMYYPRKHGWQTGIELNGKSFYWYVYDKKEWQNVYASQKRLASQQYISKYLYAEKSTEENVLSKENDFPKLYFFILLLICCGFLWMENKYVLSAGK